MDVRIEGLRVPRADGTTDNPVGMIDAVVHSGDEMVADSGPMPLSVTDVIRDVTVLISPSPAVGTAFIAGAVSLTPSPGRNTPGHVRETSSLSPSQQ